MCPERSATFVGHIHDQSYSRGFSLNDSFDQSARPDATWQGASGIADRIVAAATQYGAATLYGYTTDIKDAFYNVPIAAHFWKFEFTWCLQNNC